MQQTNAKAIAAAIVTLIVAGLAGYFGYAVSDELRLSLETLVAVIVGGAGALLAGYGVVHQVSNAPAGAVIAAVPKAAVATSQAAALPVKVVEDAAGNVRAAIAHAAVR